MARPALRVKSKVVRNTNPVWKRLEGELRRLGGAYLKVGYLGDGEATEDGMTMPQLGAIHELGAPEVGIPARSHLGATFDRNQERYVQQLAQLLEQWYSGKLSLPQALGLLGAVMSSDVRSLITEGAGVQPPNAPSVFARKLARGQWKFRRKGKARREGPIQAPRPLVDTGRLVGALTWAVVTGKSNKPKKG